MDSSTLNRLPQDTLHQIFSRLPLRQIIICKSVCKYLNSLLSSAPFSHFISTVSPHPSISLPLIALRPSHRSQLHLSTNPNLHVFDPLNGWLRFPLSFLPFPSLLPITSSHGLLYLWASNFSSVQSPAAGISSSSSSSSAQKILIVCNPLTKEFRALPQLGSAWSRHGSVLIGVKPSQVLVLTELATLYSTENSWLKYSSNLPSKPRSPVLINECILALCDVGSPWRSQWKLYMSSIGEDGLQISKAQKWTRLEKPEWGDVFDIIKRPRLIVGGENKVLMIGGLKSSYSLHSACSTILILRLDLQSLEWDEAGRMPSDMYRSFQDSSKFKVFGRKNRVCFSAKKVGRLALWESFEENGCDKSEWRWINGVPGNSDGLCRGFVFDAQLTMVP